ncbi:MAG: hypothetical protein SGILL_010828, partial [Bacillariaceae sp.]
NSSADSTQFNKSLKSRSAHTPKPQQPTRKSEPETEEKKSPTGGKSLGRFFGGQRKEKVATPRPEKSTPPPPLATAEKAPPKKPVEKTPVQKSAVEMPKEAEPKSAPVVVPPQKPAEKSQVQPPDQTAGAAGHIQNMLRMRQQQTPKPSEEDVPSVPIRKTDKAREASPPPKQVAEPAPKPVVEAQLPPAVSQPTSTPTQPVVEEVPLPPALAQIKVVRATGEKSSPQMQKVDIEKMAARPSVAPSPPVVAKAPEQASSVEKAVTRATPPIPAPARMPVPESKPEPKIQTQEKVTELSNGKQVMDVATTTVNADGTEKRERKRKTKNSDKKKKSKPVDDGVDQHCACVVM